MIKTFVSVTLLAMLISCVAEGPEQAPPVELTKKRATHLAMKTLEQEGFEGSVLAACGQDILFRGDYGLQEIEDVHIRYWVASITKGITSIAIMRLVDDGLIKLDQDLSVFFPAVPSDKANITIFQLLTHQSGLPQSYAAEGRSNRNDAAVSIFNQNLAHLPGEAFLYSNDNYSLLAMVIEVVTSEAYVQVVDNTVMAPLGLPAIAFWPEPIKQNEHVPDLLSPYISESGLPDWGFLGGHGARLSVEEMHQIAVGLEAGKLLSPESLELLWSTHNVRPSGLGVGFGWFVETDDQGRKFRWARGSDTSGGNATLYLVGDNGLIIIAATNAGPEESSGPGWSRQARDALLEIYANPEEESCGK